MSDEGSEKKIFIDEDWKSQVEREKEELAKKKGSEPPAAESADAFPSGMPEASLAVLISMLATQAMVALGQIPNPLTQNAEVRPEEARHFIDLLHVLQEKTEGNRTADETQALEQLLHQLRMAFVAVNRGPGPQPSSPPTSGD